jgi:hypothetical protein
MTRLEVKKPLCVFCGCTEESAAVVIRAPEIVGQPLRNLGICDACVDLCAEIVESHRSGGMQPDIERIREHLGWP